MSDKGGWEDWAAIGCFVLLCAVLWWIAIAVTS